MPRGVQSTPRLQPLRVDSHGTWCWWARQVRGSRHHRWRRVVVPWEAAGSVAVWGGRRPACLRSSCKAARGAAGLASIRVELVDRRLSIRTG